MLVRAMTTSSINKSYGLRAYTGMQKICFLFIQYYRPQYYSICFNYFVWCLRNVVVVLIILYFPNSFLFF